MRSIHTFQPRKSGAAEAGIFEPSDGPTLTKQCLTVVDMGRHAAEVHLFGKNIQQKSSKPEGHAVNQHIFEKNEDWYAEHSSSLYQVYRVTICYLPPIQGSRKFHWHTYFIFGQGQVVERDEKASGQGINSGNPNDQLGATARPTLPRLETVLEPPLWFGRLSPGWKGFRQSSFVITNRFRSGVGHVTKKLSERKS